MDGAGGGEREVGHKEPQSKGRWRECHLQEKLPKQDQASLKKNTFISVVIWAEPGSTSRCSRCHGDS